MVDVLSGLEQKSYYPGRDAFDDIGSNRLGASFGLNGGMPLELVSVVSPPDLMIFRKRPIFQTFYDGDDSLILFERDSNGVYQETPHIEMGNLSRNDSLIDLLIEEETRRLYTGSLPFTHGEIGENFYGITKLRTAYGFGAHKLPTRYVALEPLREGDFPSLRLTDLGDLLDTGDAVYIN